MAAVLLLCWVLAVPDGDSLRVRCDERAGPISIRLLGLDAPELAHSAFGILEQPFGKASQRSLSGLCYGQRARVSPSAIDRYGRTLATVECRGSDASEYQVRQGMAWSYRTSQRSTLPALQAAAQAAHRGLWSVADPAPIAPSAWRRSTRGEGRSRRVSASHRSE